MKMTTPVTASTTPAPTPTPTSKPKVTTPVPTPTPAAKVSPNVIQPSPTASTLVSEPKQPNHPLNETQADIDRKDARARGYSIGPNNPPATIKVKNIHAIALNLEAGIIQPGQTGLATVAEVSNFVGQYLEEV
jgi:hypothetical protein